MWHHAIWHGQSQRFWSFEAQFLHESHTTEGPRWNRHGGVIKAARRFRPSIFDGFIRESWFPSSLSPLHSQAAGSWSLDHGGHGTTSTRPFDPVMLVKTMQFPPPKREKNELAIKFLSWFLGSNNLEIAETFDNRKGLYTKKPGNTKNACLYGKMVRHKSDYHVFVKCWTVGHAPKYVK